MPQVQKFLRSFRVSFMSFSRGFMRLALMFEHFSRTKRAQKRHSTPTKIIKNLQPKKQLLYPVFFYSFTFSLYITSKPRQPCMSPPSQAFFNSSAAQLKSFSTPLPKAYIRPRLKQPCIFPPSQAFLYSSIPFLTFFSTPSPPTYISPKP